MTTHPEPEELMAWHDGEVEADRAAELATHTSDCAACQAAVVEIARVSDRLKAWTVPAPTDRLQSPIASATRVVSVASAAATSQLRRAFYWAAAAVLVLGVLASVRVECAPAPTCERRTWRLSFFPRSESAGAVPEQAKAMSPAQRVAFERYWNSKPLFDGRPRPQAPSKGPRVVVMMFLDWQCPACRAEYRAYQPVFADLSQRVGDTVVVNYFDYPLNKRCNQHVPVELHSAACEAAVAVRLAREHGAEQAMINWLFDNQESMTPASVAAAAQRVGGVPDFDARLGSRALQLAIARDTTAGRQLGVTSTPTLFINGVLARGEENRLFTADEVRAAIEIELAKGK